MGETDSVSGSLGTMIKKWRMRLDDDDHWMTAVGVESRLGVQMVSVLSTFGS
jgi:hypothetical protein